MIKALLLLWAPLLAASLSLTCCAPLNNNKISTPVIPDSDNFTNQTQPPHLNSSDYDSSNLAPNSRNSTNMEIFIRSSGNFSNLFNNSFKTSKLNSTYYEISTPSSGSTKPSLQSADSNNPITNSSVLSARAQEASKPVMILTLSTTTTATEDIDKSLASKVSSESTDSKPNSWSAVPPIVSTSTESLNLSSINVPNNSVVLNSTEFQSKSRRPQRRIRNERIVSTTIASFDVMSRLPGLVRSKPTRRVRSVKGRRQQQLSTKTPKLTYRSALVPSIKRDIRFGATQVGEDPAVRNERSANLSHISGISRKIQLYIKNRYLQLLPDGVVNGTSDDSNDNTILQRTTVNIGQIRIQGVATCLFLCMDSCGMLYGSREFTQDCVFNEQIEQHNYNTYSSTRYSGRVHTLYLALNKRGEPRKVQIPNTRQLGKLSTYTRALTKPVPLERVEQLTLKLLGPPATPRPLRHQHGARQLCPATTSIPEVPRDIDESGRDRTRCRRRKKRRKKKRRCREDEVESELCHKRPGVHGQLPNNEGQENLVKPKKKLGPNNKLKKCEGGPLECPPKKNKIFKNKKQLLKDNVGVVKKKKVKVLRGRKKFTTTEEPTTVKVTTDHEDDDWEYSTPDPDEEFDDPTMSSTQVDDLLSSTLYSDFDDNK